MIIIGDELLEYNPLYFINSKEDIVATPPKSIVIFEFKKQKIELCRYCRENKVEFALIADEMREVIYSNAFEAKYIICDKKIALSAQKFANEYVIDSKILLYSSDESDLEWVANNAIDGILFEGGIDYGSC